MEISPQKSNLGRDFVLILVSAVLGAVFSSYFTNKSEYQNKIQNLAIINCLNISTASQLKQASNTDASSWDWNVNYLTSFYHSSWNALIRESEYKNLIHYFQIVEAMETSNNILARVERQYPTALERKKLYSPLADLAE